MKKKLRKLLEYVNPKNLSKEIQLYGYSYSVKSHLLTLLVALMVIVMFGKLLGLEVNQIIILAIVVLLGVPRLVANVYRNMYEQKKFMDVCNYAEQMLYSFKRKSKILNALEDTSVLFPDGLIGDTIQKTIDYIYNVTTEGNVYDEAFVIMEQEYGCDILTRIHNFMKRVEMNGGEYTSSIEILILDRNRWVSRVLEAQKEKQLIKRNVTIGIILSLGVVLSTVYMVPSELVDVRSNIVSQISGLLILIINFELWSFVQCKLSGSWISTKRMITDEQIEKWYEGVKSNGSKRKKYLYKKRLRREVEKAFPEWLLGLALLLQTNNVQMAIQSSVIESPIALRKELQLLQEKIEANPVSIEPYLEFYEDLNIHEIQSAMRMLYSMSQNGGEDMENQIHTLVERNVELQDQSEKLKTEDYLAGMGICVLLPMVIGCGKMLTDMALLMYELFKNTQGYY